MKQYSVLVAVSAWVYSESCRRRRCCCCSVSGQYERALQQYDLLRDNLTFTTATTTSSSGG